MKNKLLAIFLLFTFFSCRQQQDSIMYYQTDDEFAKREWFDMEEFWTHKKGGENYIKEFENSDTIRIEKGYHAISHCYFQKCYFKKDGIKMCSSSSYYLSGEMMDKHLLWDDDYYTSVIGREYHYDKMGNITTIIDHDEPFTFTMNQVKQFIKELNIKNYHLHRQIDSIPIWNIRYDDTFNPRRIYSITLHGISGDILEERTYN